MSSVFAAPQVRSHQLAASATTESHLVTVAKGRGRPSKKPDHPRPAQRGRNRKSRRRDDPCAKAYPVLSKDGSSRSCSTDEGPQKVCSRVKFSQPSRETQMEGANSYQQKFKTEMCKNFELQGTCRWGDGCSYAHGLHELREKTHLNTNYRSKICKLYHRQGGCPYGLR